MIKNLFIIVLVFSSLVSFAQEDWRIYKSVNGVNIYTKEADCVFKDGSSMNQTVVLFKIVNKNNKAMTIEWDTRIWYNGVESINNSSPEERHVKFTIEANSVLKGDCSLKAKNLYLYKKFLDFEKSKMMTKFILDNLKVV
jgi:hypothetical protein